MSAYSGSEKCDVIVVAGGRGHRYGTSTPKQFDWVNGRPLCAWALEPFMNWPSIGHVVLVVPEIWPESPLVRTPEDWMKTLQGFFEGAEDKIHVTVGGETRQESATKGLKFLEGLTTNAWVMIHDGARPAVTRELLENLWKICRDNEQDLRFGGAVPALPPRETVKTARKMGTSWVVQETLPRPSLFYVQTPQCLRRSRLLEAYAQFQGQNAVDDSSLLEKMGEKILLIDGEQDNIKVTFAEDRSRVSDWLGKRHPQI